MQLSNIPGKLVLPFANAGGKSTIPVASQIGITAGAASLTDGFPPLTRTPVAAGGVPPSGLDMNGILYEMSAIIRWANAGGGYPFDGTFATDTNVGGYPKGARIMRSDGTGYWFNTVENNVTDPESAGAATAGWVPDYQSGATSVAMSGSSVTLTPNQYGKPLIVITGTLSANLNLIFPPLAQGWSVINNTTGGYGITAKTSAGTGVLLQSGVNFVIGDSVNIQSFGKSKGRVFLSDFGIIGDASDDTVKFQAAANFAGASNWPLDMEGKAVTVSTITLAVDLEIVGKGSIVKKAGTTGHLINTSANLKITGSVTINQNAANCPNGSASYNTDCAINHTGASLILDGVTSLPSISANINTSASSLLLMNNCTVSGGMLCVRGVVASGCKVRLTGGRYSASTLYDNIQILNSQDFVIDGVTSFNSYMSGIVASDNAANGKISNCTCYGNQVHSGEGGWGIVLSVLVTNVTIVGNTCYGNQNGPLTIDTTPIDGSTNDGHITVTGNMFIGDYAGGYCVTGINVNKANQVNIVGNYIRKATQSILVNVANHFSISGNVIEDCGSGYFFQPVSCSDFEFSYNVLRTCITSTAGAISIQTSTFFKISNNQLVEINGANRSAVKFNGACTDFSFDGNKFEKSDSGTGYMVYVAGNLTNGRFTGNKFRSATTAWQYYIVATGITLTDVVTERNEIAVPSVQTNPNRYVLNGAAIVADGDTLNGIRDYFSAAPTYCTFRQGQTAGIAGALKMWNGSAWV